MLGLKDRRETMNNLEKELNSLKKSIESAYQEGVTIPQAEKLASKTLLVRMQLADEIQCNDLDARMKRQGVKAVRGQEYTRIATASDKKPTETAIESQINTSELVIDAENEYAIADTAKDRLQLYSGILADAHIFFRYTARGTFEG